MNGVSIMKSIYHLLPAVSLMFASFTTQADTWSGRNLIEEIQVADGTNYVRMRITSTENPASCLNTTFIDYQLDTGNRSETEQRLMLDAFNMAMIMNKPVEFFIDGDKCTTTGTSSSIRIANGFRVHRN